VELMERYDDVRAAVMQAVDLARAVLEGGRPAVDAVQSAIMFMEAGADFFNAGRGSVLCADGSVEMSAALMQGADRRVGAVAGIKRTKQPIVAARAVLGRSSHVLLVGEAADAHAAASGAEMIDSSYFVTDRQRRRLAESGAEPDRGTVGVVCLDAEGLLAAGTSTGGMRRQLPGRVGDSPLPGAGTWADDHVAVSCTGDGEAFIRAGAARHLATLVAAGVGLKQAAAQALAEVAELGGQGGLIAVDAEGNIAMPFNSEAMPRGTWRAGDEPATWV
jgi:isoaspartyl peptidase/L-asparaginase-like protein (Ntn-hydrolase superfamily)